MVVGGFAEAFSLGLVVPFLAFMTAPNKINDYYFLQVSISKLKNLSDKWLFAPFCNLEAAQNMLFVFTFLFIIASIISGSIRLVLVWVSVRLAAGIGVDLGLEAYRRTLYQPYLSHIDQNSGHLISSLTNKMSFTLLSINSVMTLFTSVIIAFFIAIALLAINALVTLIASIFLLTAYGFMMFICNKKLKANSSVLAQTQTLIIKLLQESLGGIRDILLDGTQKIHSNLYQKTDKKFRRAYANIIIIGNSPRYIMETIGMVFFAVLAFIFSAGPNGLSSFLPTLGAFALGVQRLLPTIQQGFQAWSTIVAYQESSKEVFSLLNQATPKWAEYPQPAPLDFKHQICFENVKFRYLEKSSWVLDKLSFTIPKGSRVGFVGKTGSGKSTCLDLLMGLLEPSEGKILIDGTSLTQQNLRAWQINIAHVPQAIYLSDSSFAENIAFGIPAETIDLGRVREAARQAQIADFIESSPKGYQALVGERGVRLSGGQRQRIGIARALYKQAQVLVFDEATSALDHETENAVMGSIHSLSVDLTILIIAHRTSTLKKCDQVINLNDQKKT